MVAVTRAVMNPNPKVLSVPALLLDAPAAPAAAPRASTHRITAAVIAVIAAAAVMVGGLLLVAQASARAQHAPPAASVPVDDFGLTLEGPVLVR